MGHGLSSGFRGGGCLSGWMVGGLVGGPRPEPCIRARHGARGRWMGSDEGIGGCDLFL